MRQATQIIDIRIIDKANRQSEITLQSQELAGSPFCLCLFPQVPSPFLYIVSCQNAPAALSSVLLSQMTSKALLLPCGISYN